MELLSLFIDRITQNRKPNYRFNSESRASMITLRIKGYTFDDIAELFGITRSTVYKIYRRFYNYYDFKLAPRSSALYKLLIANIRFLLIQIKRNRLVLYYKLYKDIGKNLSLKIIARVVFAT